VWLQHIVDTCVGTCWDTYERVAGHGNGAVCSSTRCCLREGAPREGRQGAAWQSRRPWIYELDSGPLTERTATRLRSRARAPRSRRSTASAGKHGTPPEIVERSSSCAQSLDKKPWPRRRPRKTDPPYHPVRLSQHRFLSHKIVPRAGIAPFPCRRSAGASSGVRGLVVPERQKRPAPSSPDPL